MVAGAICLAVGAAFIGIAVALRGHEDLRQDLAEIKKINNLNP